MPSFAYFIVFKIKMSFNGDVQVWSLDSGCSVFSNSFWRSWIECSVHPYWSKGVFIWVVNSRENIESNRILCIITACALILFLTCAQIHKRNVCDSIPRTVFTWSTCYSVQLSLALLAFLLKTITLYNALTLNHSELGITCAMHGTTLPLWWQLLLSCKFAIWRRKE